MSTDYAPAWRLWLATVLRLVLAGVLIVAGWLKLPEPAASVRAVRAYQLLPESVVPSVGHALPLLEIIVGVLLLVGLATRFAAAVAGLLMLAFIIGISSAWARGLTIDCGCFGGGGTVAANQTKYAQEIARDVGLLLAAAFLVVWPASRLSIDHTPSAGRDPMTDTEPLTEKETGR
ncbi:DoxX family protein [Angustibacter luteus]|uniref:DoxX family protein n=1 Tax=Angustibacter luteus TaxID=658456 RepID=A0ABW1JCF4_9ACTN